MMIQIFILGLILVALISIVYSTVKTGITPTPTSNKVKKELLRLLEYYTTNHNIDLIYELGSGWGTLAFPIAKLKPKTSVIGVELSIIPFLYTRVLNVLKITTNLKFKRSNFYNLSLNKADLVVCYLYPGAMKKLQTQFEEQLNPGTIIISQTFALPNWRPLETIKINDFYQTKIYVYKK